MRPFFLLVASLLCSCADQGRQVTENCRLVRTADRFQLVLTHEGQRHDTIARVDRLGWQQQTILVHHTGVPAGWVVVFDPGDLPMKSWGSYSDRELPRRLRELDMNLLPRVVPAEQAWKDLH